MKPLLEIEIPGVPPSVNHYWMSNGKRRYLSAKALSFIKLVVGRIQPQNSVARLSIDLEFCFPDRRVRDLDNFLKGTLDSLVKAGLCEDDSQFDRISVSRGEVIKGGLTRVRVNELIEG